MKNKTIIIFIFLMVISLFSVSGYFSLSNKSIDYKLGGYSNPSYTGLTSNNNDKLISSARLGNIFFECDLFNLSDCYTIGALTNGFPLGIGFNGSNYFTIARNDDKLHIYNLSFYNTNILPDFTSFDYSNEDFTFYNGFLYTPYYKGDSIYKYDSSFNLINTYNLSSFGINGYNNDFGVFGITYKDNNFYLLGYNSTNENHKIFIFNNNFTILIQKYNISKNNLSLPQYIYYSNISKLLYIADNGFHNINTFCVNNWVCNNYENCLINDTQKCNSTIDLNNCGVNYTGDYTEFNINVCDYCTPDFNCDEYTNCTTQDLKFCDYVNDSNNCYAQTNLTSDLYTGNYSEFNTYACDYCTPNFNCISYNGCDGIFNDCNNVTDSNSCYIQTNLTSDLFNGSLEQYKEDCKPINYSNYYALFLMLILWFALLIFSWKIQKLLFLILVSLFGIYITFMMYKGYPEIITMLKSLFGFFNLIILILIWKYKD